MNINLSQTYLKSTEPQHSEFPLSYNQQAVWLLPENMVHHIFSTVVIRSVLDTVAWQRSWQKLAKRHPILRTSYLMVEGEPRQVIHPHADIDIKLIDASGWSEVSLQEKILEEINHPFDLESGSVVRVRLFTKLNKEVVQLAVIHPIAGDDWSLDILLNDLPMLYTLESKIGHHCESFSDSGVKDEHTDIDYTNFVCWQSQMLASSEGDRHRKFWQQLADEFPVLELPLNKRRNTMHSYCGASHLVDMDPALLLKLRELAETEKVSLYSVMLANLKVLLHRYTGQDIIRVGTLMSGRGGLEEFQSIVGSFANPVILQSQLAGNPNFNTLLSQVARTVDQVQEHQDYPFPLLANQLIPESDEGCAPLYQVSFIWQDRHWYLQETGLNSTEFVMKPYLLKKLQGDSLDLSLKIWEIENSIVLCWQYNANLFNADTIARLACHYQILLEGILDSPEQQIADLPLLSEAELQQLLVEWNNTQTPYPDERLIQQLFEEKVKCTPDAVAVIYEAQQLTYRDLNQRANQLAHYLQTLGLIPETLVGICVERSLDMIVGLLGILKAGGVYVPLDVTYPKERLAYILSDANVPVLLTQERLIQAIPTTDAKIICLDSDWSAIAEESKENLVTSTTADNLAYINYTSGSTGKPKGVAIPHRGVIRLLFGVDYVRLDSSRVHLQIAPIAFDAATFELWGALLHGGCCVLFSGKLTTVQRIRHTIKTYGVTTLWLTAALFNTIIDDLPETFLEIQQLLIGGEALSVSHIQKALEMLPSTEIINGYGPTENTTFTSTYPIPKPFDKNLSSIPIGRPIGNTQMYVLDTHLQLVPIGVTGELYLGGAGLARCYLHRPDLTEERFIPNPLKPAHSDRLYKTGDLVRYLPDGNIEFLGRIDNQVKIRGFRIELEEIETLLAGHPKLQRATVVVRELSYDNKQLIAYVIPIPHQEPTLSELRDYLQQKLPNYMIPSNFVLLEDLPLTSNGKVDRRNLSNRAKLIT